MVIEEGGMEERMEGKKERRKDGEEGREGGRAKAHVTSSL